jgi:hypothetical protein
MGEKRNACRLLVDFVLRPNFLKLNTPMMDTFQENIFKNV